MSNDTGAGPHEGPVVVGDSAAAAERGPGAQRAPRAAALHQPQRERELVPEAVVAATRAGGVSAESGGERGERGGECGERLPVGGVVVGRVAGGRWGPAGEQTGDEAPHERVEVSAGAAGAQRHHQRDPEHAAHTALRRQEVPLGALLLPATEHSLITTIEIPLIITTNIFLLPSLLLRLR